MDTIPAFEGFAIVELLGHRTLAGHCADVPMLGGRMLRIDVALPDDRTARQYYAAGAIFGITPTTAEHVAKRATTNEWELNGFGLLSPEDERRLEARVEAAARLQAALGPRMPFRPRRGPDHAGDYAPMPDSPF